MNINYAELYGIKPGESDFSGAIKRLNGNVLHLDKFVKELQSINKYKYIGG